MSAGFAAEIAPPTLILTVSLTRIDTWNAPVLASSNARRDDFEAPVFSRHGGVENGAEAGKDHEGTQGDDDVRHTVYEADNALLTRFTGWSALKAWGMQIAKKHGLKRATVAMARKLAVIMHAMWKSGTEYRWTSAAAGERYERDKRYRLRNAVI